MSEFYKINNTVPITANVMALARAFGLQNVIVPDARSNQYEVSTLANKFVKPDKELYRSQQLGTPVFADLTLGGGSYTDSITGNKVNFPELRFSSVLITVDFPTRIIKTEIQGRNGTVKEYIGQDDAKINIQGIVCGSNGVYPINDVSKLNEWRRAPLEKKATSRFLQALGIDSIVVESCGLPQISGGYSYQTFTIQCISDAPVQLKIV
jgi:hypothetical protein